MANKKEIKRKTGGPKKKSGRRSSYNKRKKKSAYWIYYILAALFASLFIAWAYYVLFRPYVYRFRPCYGQKYYEICLPRGQKVYGIDVSNHQKDIDWEKIKNEMHAEAPISFVYIKATEGSDFKDKSFDRNFAEAKKQGFIRGAYHYFGTKSSGQAQAEMFIKTVKLEKGDLPPMVNVEVMPKDKKRFMQELKIFIAKIEGHYGVKPIIYSYEKFKHKHLKESFFDRYPSWVAHYYIDSLDEGIEWLIWQCSDIGEVPGIETSVDINIFNGNVEQLKSLLIK